MLWVWGVWGAFHALCCVIGDLGCVIGDFWDVLGGLGLNGEFGFLGDLGFGAGFGCALRFGLLFGFRYLGLPTGYVLVYLVYLTWCFVAGFLGGFCLLSCLV